MTPSADTPSRSQSRIMHPDQPSNANHSSAFVIARIPRNVVAILPTRCLLAAIALLPVSLTGCSVFPAGGMKMPAINMLGTGLAAEAEAQQENYVPVGASATLPSSTFTQEAYQAVRNAKANNSIVLQILDAEEPIRVLPLPTSENGTGQSVFVSTLLKQTGVLKKLGKAQAALYRSSPTSFEGVRMDVLFVERAPEQVRPESDYALRPGDRIVIAKDTRMGMESLIDMVLDR
ncbi:hypothetical protein [Rhodopirellula sallentina]|nr:hypothetical protein [Rhodopirellula sallentina]